MEAYGKILLIAMPAFLLLVLFEKWYGWRKGFDTVRNMDMISSLSSGITNVTKDVVGLYLIVLSYPFFLRHLALVEVKATWLVYLIAFVALDFAGYWIHRLQHVFNFFWNGHIIHHSSEEYNLACALRQSISGIVKTFAVFLLPAAIFGVPANVIAIVAPLHLFAQFWYHTRHIGRMGFLELFLVTPSHHRVHHAINPEYIDKNFSQILIIWDRLFGTFQEEQKNIPPVYGITRPVATWNPIRINFQHVWLLIKDAWHAHSWWDKLRIWFMPTGWRPADVAAQYPVYKIVDVYHFEKYDEGGNPFFATWIWIQMTTLLLLVSYLFANIGLIKSLDSSYIILYGIFVFIYVYAYTELMDRNKYAPIWEALKAAMAIGIIIYTGDWFGASGFVSGIQYVLIGWFLLSFAITFWLSKKEQGPTELSAAH
ncbi:MAG: sterol desaturase family protein [Chitinophagaceae bacterium]